MRQMCRGQQSFARISQNVRAEEFWLQALHVRHLTPPCSSKFGSQNSSKADQELGWILIQISTIRLRLHLLKYCREEDAGQALDEYIGPGLQLMRQDIEIEQQAFSLIVPRSSDAVIDFYINSGVH